MTRRLFEFVLIVSAALFCFGAVRNAEGAERPNFVFILADDMGYGDAGCYPDSWLETPHLDRLAREGLRFTDFHSSGAVCSPTRAGFLTGRYQQRAGIPGVVNADPKQNRHQGLHQEEVTFSELLSGAGYRTAVFGKWHVGYRKKFNPLHHGFDRFRGYVSGNVCYISHCDRMGIFDWWNGLQLEQEEGYSTHLITRHAVEFIEQAGEKPFCLYIAHEAVHSPYQGPGDEPVRAAGRGRIRENERSDIKAAYREMMTEMDRGIGQVVAALREQGVAENTLVFFFSDNGANRNGSNGRLRGFKGSVWEGGHRVPAVAWWPGTVEAGSVTETTAISIDLMPTMLDLAGVEVPEEHKLDGVSLKGLLTEGKDLPARDLFWDYRGRSAVRRGEWKLVVGEGGQGGRVGLYDLGEDLGEERNVAERHPDKVETLQGALEAWKKDVMSGATEQPAEP